MGDNYNQWNYHRAWMYNRIDPYTNNISREFQIGVEGFMEFAGQSIPQDNRSKLYCPCSKCENDKQWKPLKVSNHLFRYGFMPGYFFWYMHGEEINVELGSTRGNTSFSSGYQGDASGSGGVEDRYVDMVNDAFYGTSIPGNTYPDEQGSEFVSGPNPEAKKFYDMLDAAKNPLYEGCREGRTQLSLAARMMNIKVGNEMSENCADQVAEMVSDYLLEGNNAVDSYYKLEKLMRNLGLPFHTIDVCYNNCMIYWKEDEKWDQCKFCGHQRWEPSKGRTKIPFSRMWYLPIGDRLKRLYLSEHTAAAMRWNAEHESQEGEMCHPSDAAERKNFNQLNPNFQRESRNVYLGLCTDGFNPFGMSKNHSLWPVLMIPYNLPPGMCIKREYLFLTIMNSCPKHPRGSLDIFLRPLIDELKDLWSTGIEAFDVSRNEKFRLKVVLLWTISDFPAYGMLSGWTTHGKLSCPICMEDTRSFQLPNGRKPCWFNCHRRFLPHNHPLRRNKKNFLKGKTAKDQYPPESLTGEQVLYERLRGVNPSKTCDVGGNGHEEKQPGYGKLHNWHKDSGGYGNNRTGWT